MNMQIILQLFYQDCYQLLTEITSFLSSLEDSKTL